MAQPTLINLHSKLDRYVKRNTLNELSNKVCVQTKTEDLNSHVFDMIIEI